MGLLEPPRRGDPRAQRPPGREVAVTRSHEEPTRSLPDDVGAAEPYHGPIAGHAPRVPQPRGSVAPLLEARLPRGRPTPYCLSLVKETWGGESVP